MGFLSKVNEALDKMSQVQFIVSKNKTNGSVNFNLNEGYTASEITVDVVKEAMRRFGLALDRYAKISAILPYKHCRLDKDEMCKQIIKSLGDMKYVQSLIDEIKAEASNDKRTES